MKANLVLAAVAVLVMFLASVYLLVRSVHADAELRRAINPDAAGRAATTVRLSAAAARSPHLARLSRELDSAGLAIGATEYLAVTAGLMAVGGYLVAIGVSTALGWLISATIATGSLGWVRRMQAKRNEALISQLPALVRILSNTTGAGLSLARGLDRAASELEEPIASELMTTRAQLHYGQSVDQALAGLAERLPSAELRVMVTTLIIQHRRGGESVTSLQEMARTLEARKVLRGEVRTMMAGPKFTGYATMALGAMSLLMLNSLSPGAVDAMFHEWLGRLALVVAGSLFAIGGLVIRRVTRIAT